MIRRHFLISTSVIVGWTIIAAGARPGQGTRLPARQYLLTIEGENTVTFVPQAGLNPSRIDYRHGSHTLSTLGARAKPRL